MLATEKSGLLNEVEAQKANAEQVLATAEKAKIVIEKAPTLLAELNPEYKEKQATEQRFGKIENSIDDMKGIMSKILKKLEEK